MVSYDVSRTFRLSADDNRHLYEIMEAIGGRQADALRLALEVTVGVIQHAVENDPAAVFIEYQHRRGRQIIIEKMSDSEKDEAMLYVRDRIGHVKFDNYLKRGREETERKKRDMATFEQAKHLLATMDPPYTFEQIAQALSETGRFSLPHAKRVLDRIWRMGDQLIQEKPGKYKFAEMKK